MGKTESPQESKDAVAGGTDSNSETIGVNPSSATEIAHSEDEAPQTNVVGDEPAMSDEDVAAAESNSKEDASASIDELIAKGISLVQANQRKQAMTPLKRASNLAPKEVRADFYLGLLYLGVGAKDLKDAKEILENSDMWPPRIIWRWSKSNCENSHPSEIISASPPRQVRDRLKSIKTLADCSA